MNEGKTEEDFAKDLASLEGLLPASAAFVKGVANSSSKKLKSVAAAPLTKPTSLKEPAGIYTFEDPIYVRQVHFYGPELAALRSGLTVVAIGIDGKESKHLLWETSKGTGSQYCVAAVNRVAVGPKISIKGKKPVPVTQVSFTGYRFPEVEEMSGRLTQALNLRNVIDKFAKDHAATFKQTEAKLTELRAEIDADEDAKTELESAISVLEGTKSTAESGLAAVRAAQADEQKTLAGLEEKVTAARNNESQLKTDVRSLNEDIGELKREMRELENDRSVISDEYRDYVKEGQGQAKLYAWIASACLGASLAGAGILVWGAAHYLEPRVTSTSEAYALFVQRLPFTAAFAATIALLLKLADYLIKGVYAIHQSRLTLARLLVLAKDTVYSSAADLDVSDAERLKERIRLKVDLLRQYLSAELGAKVQATETPAAEQKKPGGDDDDEPAAVSKSGRRG